MSYRISINLEDSTEGVSNPLSSEVFTEMPNDQEQAFEIFLFLGHQLEQYMREHYAADPPESVANEDQ